MSKALRTWDEYLIGQLAQSEDEAVAYLNAAVEENHLPTLLLALRHVVEARGGLGKLARDTKLNRAGLYRQLTEEGNPTISSFQTMLDALGFKLVIQAKTPPGKKSARRGVAVPHRNTPL